jgi:hypothetical protein
MQSGCRWSSAIAAGGTSAPPYCRGGCFCQREILTPGRTGPDRFFYCVDRLQARGLSRRRDGARGASAGPLNGAIDHGCVATRRSLARVVKKSTGMPPKRRKQDGDRHARLTGKPARGCGGTRAAAGEARPDSLRRGEQPWRVWLDEAAASGSNSQKRLAVGTISASPESHLIHGLQ